MHENRNRGDHLAGFRFLMCPKFVGLVGAVVQLEQYLI